ncbi:exo-beta-N-acetylmuramidase NamZ domain-containing protein [Gracilimonas sp. Q87]|uniref:exo-beta-N-acetylmuramidase NamZ family protein n=1 Tax=Gracilimonas sp. Q87 TaxID=3384766 RepID=UPI003983F12F
MKTLPLLLFFTLTILSCSDIQSQNSPAVKTGAEVLLDEHLEKLKGRKVGLIMNPTSRVDGTHMLDTLLSLGVNIRALYAAEHGFRGEAAAGEIIEDGVDRSTGLPVYSLYGSSKKPSAEMLDKVDLLLFDLPDMGVRFYTYSATMGMVLEAAWKNDKEVWVLDRPNPLGGEYVAGWTLEERYKSFVGYYPMPIVYGLTMGEIAQMAVGEGWINTGDNLKYKVIEMEGWNRKMIWPDTKLPWIAPSPNLPSFDHAFAYTGTVIFEGTNLSEGRGTDEPFLTIGSPGFTYNSSDIRNLEEKHHVRLDSVCFIPKNIPGKALIPKLENIPSKGIKISFPNGYENTDPLKLGLDLLVYAREHTDNFEVTNFANKLFGIDIESSIESGKPLPGWEEDVSIFKTKRQPYLLYK